MKSVSFETSGRGRGKAGMYAPGCRMNPAFRGVGAGANCRWARESCSKGSAAV
jgi:hypothetical protein